MKIVFMGTPPFAAHLLSVLVEGGHEVEAVFTKPDTPQGRGKKLGISAVKAYAVENNLALYQPHKLEGEEMEALLEKLQPDFLVVAAYGKILPQQVLSWAKIAPINIHASLLPQYRGSAPIQWAVRNGDSVTGISFMRMEEGLDSGAVYHMEKLSLEDGETTGTLFDRLATLSGEHLLEVLEGVASGKLVAIPQDESTVTYAPRFEKEDEKINWALPAHDVKNLIHALSPTPGAYTLLGDLRLKFYQAEVVEGEGEAGHILEVSKKGLKIACGEGAILLHEVQPQGKKLMSVAAFLNGTKLTNKDKLG